MLIVKGENQKSVLANILMDKTNSICFEYYNSPVIFNSVCVDSSKYSLEDFIECIAGSFKRIDTHTGSSQYQYLIIYTNQKEEDLKELINWLEENMWRIFCQDILVMCR